MKKCRLSLKSGRRKGVANERSDKQIGRLCFRTNHDVHNYQSDGEERVMNDLEIMKSYCNKCKHKGTCISICPTVWFAVLQKEHKEGSSK